MEHLEERNILFVRVQYGVSRLNFYTYYVLAFFSISFFVFEDSAQKYIIDRVVPNLSNPQRVTLNANLSFYSELLVIVVVSIWGTLSDKLGRRVVYAAGFGFCALGFGFVALARSEAALYACRMVFAVGAGSLASMLTAVLADYVTISHKGKGSGLLGVMSGLGAVMAATVYLKVPTWLAASPIAYQLTYVVIAVIALFSCVGALVGLQPLSMARQAEEVTGRPTSHFPGTPAGVWQHYYQGLIAPRREPMLCFAYAAGFMARLNSIALSLQASLYIQDYAVALGQSNADALALAGMRTGIGQAIGLPCALLVGYAADKIGRLNVAAISCFVFAVGCVGLFFHGDPTDVLGAVFVSVMGVGNVCTVTAAQAVVTGYAAKVPEVVGSVSGLFGLCGSMGVLFGAKIGGLVYNRWSHGGEFLVFGIVNLLFCVAALMMFTKHKLKGTATAPVDVQSESSLLRST